MLAKRAHQVGKLRLNADRGGRRQRVEADHAIERSDVDPDGQIVKSYEVADPAGHGAAVLADLAAAQR